MQECLFFNLSQADEADEESQPNLRIPWVQFLIRFLLLPCSERSGDPGSRISFSSEKVGLLIQGRVGASDDVLQSTMCNYFVHQSSHILYSTVC